MLAAYTLLRPVIMNPGAVFDPVESPDDRALFQEWLQILVHGPACVLQGRSFSDMRQRVLGALQADDAHAPTARALERAMTLALNRQ